MLSVYRKIGLLPPSSSASRRDPPPPQSQAEMSVPPYAVDQPGMQSTQGKGVAQPQEQQPVLAAPQNNFASATPLVSLQRSPAPVDCPMCRTRQMTTVDCVSGGTTQYVIPNSLPSLQMKRGTDRSQIDSRE